MKWQGEKQLQNPSPPTTDIFQLAILKLHFCWHTWLAADFKQSDVAAKLGWRKSASCSSVIPGNTDIYIGLDWREGDVFIVAFLLGCLTAVSMWPSQRYGLVMPSTNDPTNTSSKKEGLKENSWKKQTANGLGGEFNESSCLPTHLCWLSWMGSSTNTISTDRAFGRATSNLPKNRRHLAKNTASTML